MFLLLCGEWEEKFKEKKTKGGGCQRENIKGLDANNWVQNATFINNLDGAPCP